MAQQIKITHTSNADMNIGIPKNLTAVEWLWNELLCQHYFKRLPVFEYQQAKQMEKEQIMKAVDRGFDEGCKFPEDMSLSNSEQYYNETYNK